MKGIYLSYLRSFTLATRKPTYGILLFTLISWACIGPATGHTFVLIDKNVMVHFSGLPAHLFSAALFATTGALMLSFLRFFVSDEVRRKTHKPAMRRLRISALIFLILAITFELTNNVDDLTIQLGRTGLFSDETLRRFLFFPDVKIFVDTWRSSASDWLFKSCLWLIAFAIICKFFGATKESAERHPIIVLLFSLLFGLPFLTVFSLMLIEYTFYSLPSGHYNAGIAPYAEHLAMSLYTLIMLTDTWLFSALAAVMLVVRVFGGTVQWQTAQFADTLPIP